MHFNNQQLENNNTEKKTKKEKDIQRMPAPDTPKNLKGFKAASDLSLTDACTC